MALPPKLQELLDMLDMVGDRSERIAALISLSQRFKPVALPQPYEESHRVPGCESEAFVWAFPRGDGAFDYEFAVLNPQGVSAMAMAVILKETLSGETSVNEVPEDIVYEIFGRELSMGKSMGLMGMVRMAKALSQ